MSTHQRKIFASISCMAHYQGKNQSDDSRMDMFDLYFFTDHNIMLHKIISSLIDDGPKNIVDIKICDDGMEITSMTQRRTYFSHYTVKKSLFSTYYKNTPGKICISMKVISLKLAMRGTAKGKKKGITIRKLCGVPSLVLTTEGPEIQSETSVPLLPETREIDCTESKEKYTKEPNVSFPVEALTSVKMDPSKETQMNLLCYIRGIVFTNLNNTSHTTFGNVVREECEITCPQSQEFLSDCMDFIKNKVAVDESFGDVIKSFDGVQRSNQVCLNELVCSYVVNYILIKNLAKMKNINKGCNQTLSFYFSSGQPIKVVMPIFVDDIDMGSCRTYLIQASDGSQDP